MPEEVAPGIYRLSLPMPDNPMGTVNAYAVALEHGWGLIDCGWDTPETSASLHSQLEELHIPMKAVRHIVVTHLHPDHFGLASHLAEETDAPVSMHRLDAHYIGARYSDTEALVRGMEEWLRLNGTPTDELHAMSQASLSMVQRVGTRRPDTLLEGGETLAWGPYHFEILWTPGHSAGQICLFDSKAGILVSSDHVLQRVSPHVGLHMQSGADPLHQYLESLNRVRDLPVRMVLPGHGKPFADLAGRVDEIYRHHRDRLDAMQALVENREDTGYGVATRLSWRGARDGWSRLAPFQRRMALTETLAHLEYLRIQSRMTTLHADGVVVYGNP